MNSLSSKKVSESAHSKIDGDLKSPTHFSESKAAIRTSSMPLISTGMSKAPKASSKRGDLIPKKVEEFSHLCRSVLIEDKIKEVVSGFP